MNIKLDYSEQVKPLMKFINREQTLRSNWLVGESNSSLLGQSTWSEKKRNKVKTNYLKRIVSGEVRVFYLDLIEHCINETKHDVPSHFSVTTGFTTKINKINTFYRLVAYYEAIKELGIDHRTK